MAKTADAPEQDAQKVPPPAPKPRVAAGDSITLIGFENARWRHDAAPGTTREDLVHPAYFSQIGYHRAGAGKLKSFDIIECVGPDGKWWAELLVASAENVTSPSLIELRYVDLSKVPVNKMNGGLPPDYDIVHDAQKGRYYGKRISDGARMTIDFPSHEEARRELMNHAVIRQTAHA